MSSLEQLEWHFSSMKVRALRDIGDRIGIKDVRAMRKEPALIPALMVWYVEKYIDEVAAAEIEDSALDVTVHDSAEQGPDANSVFGALSTKFPLIERAVFARMIQDMHKKLMAEQEGREQLSQACVRALHANTELLIALVIADSIAISEDTGTKRKGSTLRLQKGSMYLAQALRKERSAGTLRALLAAFNKRDAQRSTARGEAPNEAEDEGEDAD